VARLLRRVGLGLLAVAALLLAGLSGALLASRPGAPATAALPLDAPATVRFDAHARPWVQAASFADALTILGWLHARERSWQMELLRRAGRGRLAELLGEDLLEADRTLVRAGVPALGRNLGEHAGAEARGLVARYVAGVNAALDAQPVPAPEFLLLRARPVAWTPEDVFAVAAIVAWDSANNLEQELLRLALRAQLDDARFRAFLPAEARAGDFPWVVPAATPGPPVAATLALLDRIGAARPGAGVPRPAAGLGSSAWAVAAERSALGVPLFAFDSHDGWSMPALQYEVHLFHGAPGEDRRALRGWTVPGLPGVINGFSDRFAWGMTNVGDSQDLFLETRDPADPLRFRGRAGWYRATVRQETIPVRGRATPHRERVLLTENGPLISEEPPLSLAWSGHRLGPEDAGLDALLALNRAGDRAAFEAALDAFPAPSANLLWADTDGHLGTRVIGRLPRRGTGTGLLPADARDPGSAWDGFVPAAALPRLEDPPRAWVAAANARTAPPGSAPLVSADNAPGYRMRRLREALGGARDLTEASMAALQTDVRDTQAARLLPVLLEDVDADRLAGPEREAFAAVRAWAQDPQLRGDSVGASIWNAWYVALADALFADTLGPALHARLLAQSYPLNHALDGLVLDGEASPWWRGRRRATVTEAFGAAVSDLARRLGDDPRRWRWDVLHRVAFRHELGRAVPGLSRLLDRGPWPWGGGNPVLGRARYRYGGDFEARGGASVRTVIALTEPPRAAAVIAGGQSGHFLSPHYDDQFPAWLSGTLLPLASAPEQVEGPVIRIRPL
jgi:penicillin amidase